MLVSFKKPVHITCIGCVLVRTLHSQSMQILDLTLAIARVWVRVGLDHRHAVTSATVYPEKQEERHYLVSYDKTRKP